MAQTAVNLVEHVLPTEAPLRQFVLTLPFELRARLAYDGKLLGNVCHAFVDSVLAWYRRHFEARGLAGAKSGAVTVVQRVSSDLRLNPHFHTLALDGVYVEDELGKLGKLGFHPLPCLTNGDVAEILQIAISRILRLLQRKGVIEHDSVNADETLADNEPALAELAVASTLGRVPAGPALHQKEPIHLRPGRELEPPKGLCATAHGFSLHAATVARADDPIGREALCKYILRPPIAQQNIQLQSDDLVRLQLKRPFSDGTFALDLDPLSLLVRLATTVPPPHFHTVGYTGVLAAASKWRARVVPPPKPPSASDDTEHDCSTCTAKDRPPTHRSGYRPWRELLMRSFKIDVERCQSCGRRMKLRALVMTSAGIERYLRWLGEPVDPPALAPARDPPYFKSRVIRRPSEPPSAWLIGRCAASVARMGIGGGLNWLSEGEDALRFFGRPYGRARSREHLPHAALGGRGVRKDRMRLTAPWCMTS